MGYLSRDSIFAAVFKTDEVDVPEWGGTVLVREMTAAEVDEVSSGMIDGTKVDTSKVQGRMPKIVSWCVIDAEQKPVFKRGDVERLAKLAFNPIIRVATRALELSGLVEEDEEEESAPNE